jgi:adenylate cyclase
LCSRADGPVTVHADLMNVSDLAKLSAWIAEHATGGGDETAFLQGVCHAFVERGLPLWRVSVATPTLDPIYRGIALTWEVGQGVTLEQDPHGGEMRAEWLRSSISSLLQCGQDRGRWRLDGAPELDGLLDLQELRAAGGTDNVLRLINFAPGTALIGVAWSFTTRDPAGFANTDLDAIQALMPALGLASAKFSIAHSFREVLGTYLGVSTAERILRGEIQRGKGQKVASAILLADLRSFTSLSDRVDALDLVRWLDEHFDSLANPIIRHNGEILKFLGDGFIAAFPVTQEITHSCGGCNSAFDAAVEALEANRKVNARRASSGEPPLEVDLVLHFGELVFGNVGSSRRLDFTLIGSALNEASRIEGHCEPLGHALLISDAFARRCDRALKEVATISLRGISSQRRVWTAA